MRKDMFKVIVERPRRGGGGKRGKGWRRVDGDDTPVKAGVRPKGSRSKRLNENLKPLERFFEKRVGKFWPKIFAEICANLDTGNAVQKHVRDHVDDIVATKMTKRGEAIFAKTRFGGLTPLEEMSWPRFYVHPTSQVLMRNPHWRRWQRIFRANQREAAAETATHYRKLDPLTAWHKVGGIWYEFRLTPAPRLKDRERLAPVLAWLHDTRAIEKTPRLAIEAFATGYAIRKRQLTSRDLAAADLANDPFDERPIRPRASFRRSGA